METPFFLSDNQKRSIGVENDMVELLWRNGQVVQHSQAHRKPESTQRKKFDHPTRDGHGESFMNLSNLIDEEDTASWIQYPVEDSLGADFCSNFFYELANSHPAEKEKAIKHFGAPEETNVLTPSTTLRSQHPIFRQPNDLNFVENTPRVHNDNSVQIPSFGGLERIENFPHFSRPIKAEIGTTNVATKAFVTGGDIGESSGMTIASSYCGSNQLPIEADRSRVSSNGLGSAGMCSGGPTKESSRKVFPHSEGGLTENLETTITSSSGGSGGSYTGTGEQPTRIQTTKRKGRDADESECQSEDADFESAGSKKAPQRSGSTRRSRAAEVHNLSERRRRDRINEKMKALQELIPHCNKSDKASMLDEAIEYLKSLQLQVQMMWMGNGMAPMMFPGVQHYISRMGMGMGAHHSLPTIHSQMQLPRAPLVDQSVPMSSALSNPPTMCPSVLNGVNFHNTVPNPDFTQPYARQISFHQMQTAQPMNMYGYGSQLAQLTPKIGLPSSSTAPCHGGAPTATTPCSKLG